ncbi:STAS domain-containing protein [Sutcliffiella rhizosphaerae]|uniref:STAS domain-containing protein n=1 Tax=Sutcliffiella rhizosphaerae TaxID=2880967 RepID=A0ABM8YSL3_9BACI|nr:STAS domain-containing protein [Sutcliffiella rhizosphaerae]CAG9623000.1 hypothetical protein BACCIP111883_03795 [Sutcliffiella rhizosphaerae]
MKEKFNRNAELTNYLKENRVDFEAKLLSEAVNVAEKINDILNEGNIDLLQNAQSLVIYVVEGNKEKLIEFAKQEGVAWAKLSLTLSFKLEWIQAIRRALWYFLQKNEKCEKEFSKEDFFELERKVNDNIDYFLNNFFLRYTEFKEEILNNQRKLVEHLSVPIIPLSPTVAVLPLIGEIDEYRMKTIEEKILTNISNLKLETMILDLSGLTDMDESVIVDFENILCGINMMGCKAVITGLRAELVRNMIRIGVTFDHQAETHGTLQQTLKKYLV